MVSTAQNGCRRAARNQMLEEKGKAVFLESAGSFASAVLPFNSLHIALTANPGGEDGNLSP